MYDIPEEEEPIVESWKHISKILPIVIQRIVDKMEER